MILAFREAKVKGIQFEDVLLGWILNLRLNSRESALEVERMNVAVLLDDRAVKAGTVLKNGLLSLAIFQDLNSRLRSCHLCQIFIIARSKILLCRRRQSLHQ
jgi:hypothetical protein